ncbi:MAG: SUMF1/EgtB/PvdO family nonheme iron enzyme [Lewinellaceae bacterium]|nr:SUMF1/EgtB/PvdO family nonheme iron enzyme [Lewinellaceae bacterium]
MAKGKDKGIGLEAAKRSRPTGANHLLAIAINEYDHHPRLSNCVRDAEELVKVLQEKYGFTPETTITLYDERATLENIYNQLDELTDKVTPNDNLLLYFSGHGYFHKPNRTGHLIPVDGKRRHHYLSNSNLRDIIRAINSFHTFLIVDSCFSGSLFASKDIAATALAEVVEGLPSRWALAAGQIETVEDGLHGDHSPFAKALLSFLDTNASPLVPASELIQHVKRVTPHNARQTPVGGVLFKTGDVGGEFVFHLKRDEAAAWAEAQQANSPEGYRRFLEAYPGSEHAVAAKKHIAELEEQAAWEYAQRMNTTAAYNHYLDKHPNGKKAREAIEAMEKLEETRAWSLALGRNTVPAFRKYIFNYPQSDKREEAEKRVRAILGREREPQAWQAAQGIDAIPAYEGYLQEFPRGTYAEAAQSRIRELKAEAAEKQRAREAAARLEQQQKEAEKKARAKVVEPPKAQPYAQAPPVERKKPQSPGGGFSHWPLWLRVAAPVAAVVLALFIWQWSTSGNSPEMPKEPERTEATTSANQPSGEEMVLIKGGPFEMGDTFGDGQNDETPVHAVTLSDFYLGIHEVTFEQFDAFCAATGASKPYDEGWGRDKRPVINVSWHDAVDYCNWRSRQERLQEVYTISGTTVTANWDANGYRLPTEAEWEFAARQRGQEVRFGNGKNSADPKEINFNGSADYKKPYSVAGQYRQKTVPVGSLNSPNNLGLHDMSGNVWEWCWDWYDNGYYEKSKDSRNPQGPDSGSYRVLRGGSWRGNPALVRVANRYSYTPGRRNYDIGFRLARAVR